MTGLTVLELERLLGSHTRAIAAAKWIYGPRAWSSELPATLPGINPEAWARLREAAALPEIEVIEQRLGEDGTRKLLLGVTGVPERAGRGTRPSASELIETVLIPAERRSTVCVSSQIGCTRSCTFCATAKLGFRRNLRAGEIVAQYLIARALAPASAPARNVVFMGMGEPMDNLDEVLTAVAVLTQTPAPQLGRLQVTVSTSGVLPGMRRFLAESDVSFALSLNATTDAQRIALMPQTKIWPLQDLLELLRADRTRTPRASTSSSTSCSTASTIAMPMRRGWSRCSPASPRG